MADRKINRRDFLKATAMAAAGVAVASCAQPTPQIIEKEVPVEKIVKETVLVEKEVAVEKIVKETVIVEKEVPIEKVIVATSVPVSKFNEAPMLAELVAKGELPPVDERLPENPRVHQVVEEIGQYGGTWRRAYKGISDRWGPNKVNSEFLLEWYMPENGAISIVNHIAEKYEQNADATGFTFYLRKGMRWSDGELLTSEDARFWYEDLVMNEEVSSRMGGNSSRLQAAGETLVLEVIDDYTFSLKFVAPNPLFPLFICVGQGTHVGGRGPNFMTPAHYFKQYHPAYASQAEIDAAVAKFDDAESWVDLCANETNASFWFRNPEVPTIHAWITKTPPPADIIMMERNPYFWCVDPEGNQLPYIDRVTHRFFDSQETFTFWLLSGEIDCQNRHVNAGDFTLLRENEEKGGYRVVTWKDAQTYSYHPNLAYEADPVLREILNERDFRVALSVALDRVEINELAWNGILEPRQACPVSGSPNYDADFEQYMTEYDPDMANELLDGIGLDKRDADGFRLRPDGATLSVLLEHMAGSFGGPDDMHLLAKDYWEAVGIKTLLRAEDRSLYQERQDANEVQIGSWVKDRSAVVMADPNWYLGSSPGDADFDWINTGGEEGVEPLPGSPLFELNELWAKVVLEPDQTKRDAMFQEIMDINKVEMLSIGVCGEAPALFVTTNNFRNVPEGLVQDDPLRAVGLGQPPQFFFKS
jgi:peptide/nickel transport system substrate-binding protein